MIPWSRRPVWWQVPLGDDITHDVANEECECRPMAWPVTNGYGDVALVLIHRRVVNVAPL